MQGTVQAFGWLHFTVSARTGVDGNTWDEKNIHVLTKRPDEIKRSESLPAAAMPDAAARASRSPTAKNGVCGSESISWVTSPAFWRMYKMEKYTTTYLARLGW